MKELWRSFIVLIFLTVLTGLIYPFMITGVGQLAFPHKANGSLILEKGTLLGSELIGQNFTNPRYFWGRPSATVPAYNPLLSQASNLGPMNPELIKDIKERITLLQSANPGQKAAIPIDLVTTSASGLDPDISVLSAEYQAPRVARARHMSLNTVNQIIKENVISPQFGFMGQTRVNVLKLNLALDQQT